MIYEDAENQVENIVCEAVANREADESVVDEYGVENLLWRIDDPQVGRAGGRRNAVTSGC